MKEASIDYSLNHPIGSNKIENLGKRKNKIAIVVEDLTRPVPTSIMLPHLIKRIRRNRVPDKNIKIVIALGLHRKLSAKEKRKLVGKLSEKIEIINHDPYDKSKLVKLRGDFQGNHDIFINSNMGEG